MQELQQKTFQKRQIAYKIKISDILNGSFIRDEFSAGYIKLNDTNISRINVIATVVYKAEHASSYSSAVIDDGTGKILLRSFEKVDIFLKVDVGDIVLMIGKIREFNNEKYIIPEILKKINNVGWLNVRKLELLRNKNIVNDNIKNAEAGLTEEVNTNINEEIYSIIRKLDKGDGISIDDVIKSCNHSEAESIINKLLESGDIFEIKPGRLKVLE